MYRIHQADCFDWLRECRPRSLHAVCTDPPYGVLEFTGKEISKLVNGNLNAGHYQIKWDASKYSSGVYYYKLITDGFSETKKMILIK